MAEEVSTGNADKSVTKSTSFKLFSPARSVSVKKPTLNPFSRLISLTRKKSGSKKNVTDAEKDSSSSSSDSDVDNGKKEENKAPAPTILKQAEEAVGNVIEEVVSHAKAIDQPLVEEMMKAIPPESKDPAKSKDQVAESKESTPAATDDKKAELLNKVVQEGEKIKEELKQKAKELGLENVYKAFAPHEKAAEDPKDKQEKSVNIEEAKAPSLAQTLQEEVVGAAAGVVAHPQDQEETSQQENSQEKEIKEEDNCVTSLAQGLQKVCGSWNNKKED